MKQTKVVRRGQAYVYDPTYARPRAIAQAVAHAFGRHLPHFQTGIERVQLNWVKPQ
jgi:hypothetical protein